MDGGDERRRPPGHVVQGAVARRLIRLCDLTLEGLTSHPESGRMKRLIEASRQRASDLVERADRLCGTVRRSARRDRVRLPLQSRAPALLDRLQRRRRTTRQLLLRHPRVRGAAGELHGHRARQGLARALVQARTLADAERHLAGAALVERVDVRVPDAAAGDAIARRHAARRDLRGRGAAADGLRGRTRRAVGHLRVGLQRPGRRGQLSVQGLRRSRPRPQARPCRRSW